MAIGLYQGPEGRVWDVVGDQRNYFQQFSPDSSVYEYSNLRRFGHSSEFSSIFSSDSEENEDYILGLIFVAAFTLAFFTAWLLQILLFKFLGPSKVGVFSGYPYEDDSRFSRCGRFTYGISSLLVLIFSIVFISDGLNSLQITADTIDAVNQDVVKIHDEFTGITTNLKMIGMDATPIRDELKDFLQQDVCPLKPLSMREFEVRSIGETTLDSINALTDFLEEKTNMLFEQLDTVQKATNEVDSKVSRANFTGGTSAFVVTLCFLATSLLLTTLILGWYEVYAESYYCFVTYLVLPVFVLLLIAAITGSGFAVMLVQANSDWCIGNPDGTPEASIMAILEKRGFQNGTLYYDVMNFYSSQCREADPWEFLQEFYTNLDKAEMNLHDFADVIEANTAEQLTQECGAEYSKALDLVNRLLAHSRVLSDSTERSMELLHCEKIVPLYTTSVYDATCNYSMSGAKTCFTSLIVIAFFGSLMVMFRGAYYPIKYFYTDDDDDDDEKSDYSTSDDDEENTDDEDNNDNNNGSRSNNNNKKIHSTKFVRVKDANKDVYTYDESDDLEEINLCEDDSDSFVESYASESYESQSYASEGSMTIR